MTDWISVKDRLPLEGGYRVIRNDPISGKYKSLAYFDGEKWLVLISDVLYWLEEPPIPEDDNDKVD